MKQATLCILVRGGENNKEILLAMKKRGFGVGKWNGVGGKLDFQKGDKNIVDAVIRETEEEIGVKIKDLEKVALLHFRFPYIAERGKAERRMKMNLKIHRLPQKEKNWDQDVHLFLVKDWQGEPKESEEMAPKWFKTNEIPYSQMWDDDKIWLPKILEGKKLKANFVFKEGETIAEQKVEIVKEL